MPLLLMAGHIKFFNRTKSERPVDYKDGGHSNLIYSDLSSHHRTTPSFYLFTNSLNNMFSGIIEATAVVTAITKAQQNVHITLTCPFTKELKIDQSIAHNGVCLTVVDIVDNCYVVTAMKETLERSNLGQLTIGSRVNIERSMQMNGRLDGHIVQGHVDQTARCTAILDAEGSTYYEFTYEYDKEMAKRGYFTVDKGSVTVNGVSLTVCQPTNNSFRVAIIPYTREHTNIGEIKVGSSVNIEFDILGKYIARLHTISQ